MSFGGGDVEEVGRWLENFATSHAKREVLAAEADVEAAGDGSRYLVRVRVGERAAPPVELSVAEVAGGRGTLAWCAALAARVRDLARAAAGAGAPVSA
jgi:hypothetical protein